MESTRPCPNCNNPASADAALCPHCGATLPPAPAPAVWPPPPGVAAPLLPPAQKMMTRSAAADIALGAALSIATCFFGGLGIIVAPILYFALRPSLPFFARGIGYGFLAGLALLLGAFAVCVYGFRN